MTRVLDTINILNFSQLPAALEPTAPPPPYPGVPPPSAQIYTTTIDLPAGPPLPGAGPVSSAGVFDSNGVLVRTLFSAQTTSPAPTWDGRLDDGTVAPTGTYTIKLLSHNVQYNWDGMVGNSSPLANHTTPFYHSWFTTIQDLCVTSSEIYFCLTYSERTPCIQVAPVTDPQSPRPCAPAAFRIPYTTPGFVCSDGTLSYFGVQAGSTDSFVVANSVTNGAENLLCLKTQHSFSAGFTYTYGNFTTAAGLDQTALFKSDMSGLAVQQAGNFLFIARGQKDQILTLDKTTGQVLQTNLTWVFPQRMATDPNDGSLWIIHDTAAAISSGTYNNTTGKITLTMAAPVTYGPGASVHVLQLTGTGAFASFENGNYTTISPTSGTTVTLQAQTGAGATTFTGGNASAASQTIIEKLTTSSPTHTVTITIAAPGVITWATHNLPAGTGVQFTTTGALPTGLVAGTTYWVANDANLTTNTFDVSNTQAHALAGTNQITTTGSQSGTQTGTASGILASSGVTITSPQLPLALSVSPLSAILLGATTLLVCDGGSSHQVKAFKTNTGAVETTFGTNGVFGTAGGYVNSPAVTNTKFMFRPLSGIASITTGQSDNSISYGTFISFAPGGDWWLGDTGNYRNLHFSAGASPSYIEQISFTPVAYSVRNVRGDPTRILVDFLEFKIDYTQPLGKTTGWTLVNNWFGNLTPAFLPAINVTYTGQAQYSYITQQNPFDRLRNAFIAPNGRTYACCGVSGSVMRVFELTPTGLRVCMSSDPAGNGALPFYLYIDMNFNLWFPTFVAGGSPLTLTENAFSRFDASNDPIWQDIGISPGQSPGQGPGVTVFTSQNMPPNTDSPGNVSEFSHIELLANGVIPMYNPHSGFRAPDNTFHLVGVNFTTGLSMFATHPAQQNHGAFNINPIGLYGGYNGTLRLLLYPEATFFPISNGVGDNGGGPLHYIAGDTQFFTVYHAEDWGNNQMNVISHWHESGLLINRFGAGQTITGPFIGAYNSAASIASLSFDPSNVRPDGNLAVAGFPFSWRGLAGFAGNAAWGALVLVNGTYYLYENDEWYHGTQRFSIKNTSSIQLATQVVNWNSGSFVPQNDPTNLLQGLPYAVDNLANGTAGWQRSPTTNLLTSGGIISSPWCAVYTTGTIANKFNPDIVFEANSGSGSPSSLSYTLTRNFPVGGLGNWTLSGTMFVHYGTVSITPLIINDAMFIDILDNNGKVIVRQYGGKDGTNGRWFVNDIVEQTVTGGALDFHSEGLVPFSIAGNVSSGVISLTWGSYTASVTVYDVAANIAAPASLRLGSFTGGGPVYIAFSKLNWVR